MVILNVMFAWLVQAGYLAGNPLSLSRQRTRRARPRIVRYLSPELWLEVKTYIQGMPAQTGGCVAIRSARQESSAMTRSPYATNE
jgi:hypothetical protein